MPTLTAAGLNVKWVDAKEGSFSAAATVNVVKDCKNPELAQLFVNYLLSDEIQSQVADVLSEAPTQQERHDVRRSPAVPGLWRGRHQRAQGV